MSDKPLCPMCGADLRDCKQTPCPGPNNPTPNEARTGLEETEKFLDLLEYDLRCYASRIKDPRVEESIGDMPAHIKSETMPWVREHVVALRQAAKLEAVEEFVAQVKKRAVTTYHPPIIDGVEPMTTKDVPVATLKRELQAYKQRLE